MGRASARCGRPSIGSSSTCPRAADERDVGLPGKYAQGDIKLCCWGSLRDMHAPTVSKFRARNCRPQAARRTFAKMDLKRSLAARRLASVQLSRGRCGPPPHFLTGFLGSAGPGTPQRGPNRRESPEGGAGGLGSAWEWLVLVYLGH